MELKEPKKKERIGDYLLVSRDTINHVVEKQINDAFAGNQKGKRIGELLVEQGILTREELENSLRQQRIARLGSCPVFASLKSTELAALSKYFEEVTCSPGEIFIRQGAEDPTFYVLSSGMAEVFHVEESGSETPIALLADAGEPIGEMGYFYGGLRTATVRALETSNLLRAKYRDMSLYFDRVPRVAEAFSAVVKKRKKEMDALSPQTDLNQKSN